MHFQCIVVEFQDAAGNTYVAYVDTDSSNLSSLVIRSVIGTGTQRVIALNFNATSTPYIMPDLGYSNPPAAKTIYLGDDSGNIHRAALLNSGSLDSDANIKSALEGGTIGELGASEAILFLGASVSTTDRNHYMRAQSASRLTVLKYNGSTTNWDKRWTSYASGAGTWNSSATYTADTSGPPTDPDNDGIADTVTATGIQSLPVDARIPGAALIIGDSIILPISVVAGNSCIAKAFLFFYSLTDGEFPDNKFSNVDGSAITTDLYIGYGEITGVNISNMSSTGKMMLHGNADQTSSNGIGVSSFSLNDNVSAGIRGWKEFSRDK